MVVPKPRSHWLIADETWAGFSGRRELDSAQLLQTVLNQTSKETGK
jgi:hypothetical protein